MPIVSKQYSAEKRADELLKQMTLDEKIDQLQSQLFLNKEEYGNRNFKAGNVRDVGCFLSDDEKDASIVAEKTNQDIKNSIEANRLGIPVLTNGEALHGAQWGKATSFPQVIGLAATFDEELAKRVGTAVAKEARAVGVRMVFAPVVNVVRDCRWGRTEESYGESVTVNSRMGTAFVQGLEENGVIATPKHFVDNYADGGRDSNASCSSWRELREVYLEPFYHCFKEGKAGAVMMAYNSVDGVPCSCNRFLMKELLRNKWKFDGIIVSDYNGVEGICDQHLMAENQIQAQAMAFNSGLDLLLPYGYTHIKEAIELGLVPADKLDGSVRRILKAKIKLGLLENPYVDIDKAKETVLCQEHLDLAEEAARKSIVLLKNENNLLPLRKEKITSIGVFGPAADKIATGGYSGAAAKIKTIYEALHDYLPENIKLIKKQNGQSLKSLAETCDVCLYFAATLEGEAKDRSEIKLPDELIAHYRDDEGGVIVSAGDLEIAENQHADLAELGESKTPFAVVLLCGSPIDTEKWGEQADAILQAWYPGQRGGEAIAKMIFGDYVPGGKLPISFPKSVGQVPIYHDQKPTGRGFAYIENDGKPRFPFGFGLSYTSFTLSQFNVKITERISIYVTVENVGKYAGDEVVQLYLHAYNGSVVRPLSELKDFCRISLNSSEKKVIELSVGKNELSCCDINGNWALFDGYCELRVGTSSDSFAFSQVFSPEQIQTLS